MKTKYKRSLAYKGVGVSLGMTLGLVLDFIIDSDPVKNNSEENRIKYLNEYLARFNRNGITITPLGDNHYKITKSNDEFVVLLDQFP